jgi:signal transduction histidine kinase
MRRILPFRANSIKARIALLAVLTCLLLGAAALGLFLLLRNSEASVISGSERHLTALAQTLALDYANHAQYEAQQGGEPALAVPDAQGSDEILALMTTVVLRREIGIEGGFYSTKSDDLLGYAFPTHEGPGVKRDIPVTERPTITNLARKAASTGQSQTQRYSGARDVIVFVAAPVRVNGTIAGSVWMMQHMQGINSGRSMQILVGVVAFAGAAFACALLAFLITTQIQAGVSAINTRLNHLQQDLSKPRFEQPQPAEFETVLAGIDRLSMTLREKIARERELENRLRHQERLSALGQFAAGIAHELRNPLATMRLRAQMTQRTDGNAATQKNLEVVLEEVSRLDAMIERLLYFSRPIQLSMQPTDLRAFCETILQSWSERLHEAAVDARCVGAEHLECLIDREKFRQVLENLISNSLEALRESSNQPRTMTIRFSAEDHFVQVQVEDNGPGLNAEAQSKAFNPFFTTKDRGTGLGLSIAYEIVKAHEGELHLENGQSSGATATVRLPRCGHTGIEV